ncbi:MAG TPA: universal stress protein [Frankiaceae bacterium]|jgi:nucleotide-binding universal stress UspA family protein|nr:universal stress protein [Frankiaceae bacterium]
MSAPVPEPATAPVVAGVDGSPASKDALSWAANYARLAGVPLRVVSAWHWPVSLVGALPMPDNFDPMAEAHETLETILADVLGADPGFPVTTQVVAGAAAAVLVEESHNAGLLVVGSRGHGGFTGLLLGSVSEHCARYAACPVVVVRHRGAHEEV